MQNIRNAKSQLNFAKPWQPSFSLSKRKNKYHKCTEINDFSALEKDIKIKRSPFAPHAPNIGIADEKNMYGDSPDNPLQQNHLRRAESEREKAYKLLNNKRKS